MPAKANVESLHLCKPLFVEVAKIAMPGDVKGLVQETALQQQKLFAFSKRFVNKIVFRLDTQSIPPSEAASSRINHTAALPFASIFTPHRIVLKFGGNNAIGVIISCSQKWVNCVDECKSGLVSATLILHCNFYWLPDG